VLTKAGYLDKLGRFGGEKVAYIVSPTRLTDLLTGTAQEAATAISSMLPVGDVPGRVAELMGAEHREGDPCDVPGAMAAQTLANTAKAKAEERSRIAGQTLATAKATRGAIEAPTVDEVTAAELLRTTASAWRQYDVEVRGWTEYDTAIAAWTAKAPGEAPAYDAASHQAARLRVDKLAAEVVKEEKAAAALRAREAAEAKAAKDAEAAEARRVAGEQAAAAVLVAEQARAERQRVADAEAAEAAKVQAVADARRADEAARAAAMPMFAAPSPVPSDSSTPCPACNGTGRISA